MRWTNLWQLGTSTLVLSSLVACGSGHGAHQHGHGDHGHAGPTSHRRFDDPERWAHRFEAGDRDAWQRPEVVVERLVTRPDLVIVDIGAATGYFPVRFARAAPKGSVVGIDIEASMVDYLNARARNEGLANLSSLQGAADDAGLKGRVPPPDLVFLCNTYHHIGARPAYFAKVRAEVKPAGRLAIVDWSPASKRGPPADHKLPKAKVIEELKQAGWRLVADHPDLPDQYFLVFEAAAG